MQSTNRSHIITLGISLISEIRLFLIAEQVDMEM